jgi:leucyl aminopeptidase
MVSAEAYRPNDIVRALSGKTIEIISTDAEGRMVLADALAYAAAHYKPRAVIDLATLTGGIVVALGKVRAGLMSNDDALAADLFAAGERAHERLWRMPLDDDYFDLIKGDDSDLVNSSSERGAHPIVGGIFLKQFVPDEVPWAHLDIAGPATTEKDMPYCPKGATGFGVRLVLDYILNWG